jgi:hypothetical protein
MRQGQLQLSSPAVGGDSWKPVTITPPFPPAEPILRDRTTIETSLVIERSARGALDLMLAERGRISSLSADFLQCSGLCFLVRFGEV